MSHWVILAPPLAPPLSIYSVTVNQQLANLTAFAEIASRDPAAHPHHWHALFVTAAIRFLNTLASPLLSIGPL